MADLPVDLRADDLTEQLLGALDVEGKIPRALDALGALAGRDIVLLDGARGRRARQLLELGARLTVLERAAAMPALTAGLADLLVPEPRLHILEGHAATIPLETASVDAVIACWSAFRGPSPAEVMEADRVLRPAGRLLVLHDYGRDDVENLWPEAQAERLAWSRRDGWFLRSGFKIRVVHCWWTFTSVEEAADLLRRAFGGQGERLAAGLKRPRLSYNVAVYHRERGAPGEPGAPREPGAPGEPGAPAGPAAIG